MSEPVCVPIYRLGQLFDVALISPEDSERVLAVRWFLHNHGYAQGSRPPVSRVLLHRFIMQPPAGMHVDHANHDPLDCRRENLRICTPSQNIRNSRKDLRPSKSGFIGVSRRTNGRWRAHIDPDGRHVHLGYFATELEGERSAARPEQHNAAR